LSRSALHEDCRKIEGERELEQYLKQSGWLIVHPEEEELPQQVALIRAARCIAAFDGSALHGLAWLGDHSETMLILLGDSPSLDYWLQFRAQKIRGWFLPCTQPFADEKPSHLQNRQLTVQARDLSETIDALALVET
jgi:capsular polysaccharide biosynthesis protein